VIKILLRKISKLVENRKDEIITFVQELIRTPSVSGDESEIAKVMSNKMRLVGFDTVKVDSINNVIGTLKGDGGRSLLLNGHIDHVPVGDMLDPYSGRLMNGATFGVDGEVIYGRGASDMKGAVGAMVMAAGVLRELGVTLGGDLHVVGVVDEERGGAGTKATITEGHLLADTVLIGEATNMDLHLGHRGAAGTTIVVKGKSCHASAPDRGVNALYKAIELIERIREDLIPRLPDDPIYGKTTLAITRISVKPDVSNVVPDECEIYLDCRNGEIFPASTLMWELRKIVEDIKNFDKEFDAVVLPRSLITERSDFNGFYTNPKNNPIVNEARNAIRKVLNREPRLRTWQFATDGRIYSRMGIPVIGFGPGEERFAHTHQDHVRVEDVINSVKVYSYLAWKLCNGLGVSV